jgi:hypothetical protein
MTIYVFKHHIPHIHLSVFTAISTRIIVNFRKRYDPCRGFSSQDLFYEISSDRR